MVTKEMATPTSTQMTGTNSSSGIHFTTAFRYKSGRERFPTILLCERHGGGGMIGDPQPFGYETESDEAGTTILRLHGDLDMGSSPQLAEVMHRLQHGNAGKFVVDLRGLSFLDSMGLSALLEA